MPTHPRNKRRLTWMVEPQTATRCLRVGCSRGPEGSCAHMERVATQETAYRLVAGHIAACNAHDVDRVTSLFAEDGSYGEFGQGDILLRRGGIRPFPTAQF